MKHSTILKKARNLIIESGHCKGELARNKYRHKVDPTSKSAVRYCAVGSVQKILGVPDKYGTEYRDGQVKVGDVCEYLREAVPSADQITGYARYPRYGYTIDEYNDMKGVTLKDVVDWFNRAIKLAKKAGN